MTEWIDGQALAQWRRMAQQQAQDQGLDPKELDWLLQHCTGLDRLALHLETFTTQTAIPANHNLDALKALWQRRLQNRYPVQYLLGKAPWRQFWLRVSPAVLIPRPETELLIDIVQEQLERPENQALARGNWVDLGTGSGAIALSLADLLPQAPLYAVDKSPEALAVAQQNSQDWGLSEQIQFLQGSWWEPLAQLRGQFAGMVSNPPYIPRQEIPQLQPEVARHEPIAALDGGLDGLDCLNQLVDTAPDYLQAGGLWLVELMAGQAPLIQARLEEQGCYHSIQIRRDLAGIERFVLAYRC
ncbi:peptide chain release factor N(5)-glutamine methyltransferase [Synechocystis sp. LKSZ1]|uniref:peptide chain release factor N(5)-glutamine methyltransferase n=1 Tax=Synechocystis sp. LKSZ1 TaxID=3144951 RepID=UPI00336C0FCD